MTMASPHVQTYRLPQHSLLVRYDQQGAFTDCYGCDVARAVPLAEYIEAFYTGRLMRLERQIIGVAMRRPTRTDDVRALANATASDFAAWRVEAREANQILLRDVTGRTCSWLMVEARGALSSRLYFGSAVVPRQNGKLGLAFHALLGFHAWYSKALLGAACKGLHQG
jgi:hypothetical protein